MEGIPLPVLDGEEAARLVRALGKHRYMAGRLVLVHAFAVAAVDPDDPWATGVLADPSVEIGSRDERLWKRATEDELARVLEAFWAPASAARTAVHARLAAWMERAELPFPDVAPFDETAEDEIFPQLVDADWELLRLAALDRERHAGVIGAYAERDEVAFEAAKFEEDNAVPPPAPYVQELPLLGPNELVRGVDDQGALVERLHLFVEGEPTYHAYVIRGVLRAAKLSV